MLLTIANANNRQLDYLIACTLNVEIEPIVPGKRICIRYYEHEAFYVFAPTVDWACGGPLAQDKQVSVRALVGGWAASIGCDPESHGSTELVAKMRCIATQAFGEAAEVPAELFD